MNEAYPVYDTGAGEVLAARLLFGVPDSDVRRELAEPVAAS